MDGDVVVADGPPSEEAFQDDEGPTGDEQAFAAATAGFARGGGADVGDEFPIIVLGGSLASDESDEGSEHGIAYTVWWKLTWGG